MVIVSFSEMTVKTCDNPIYYCNLGCWELKYLIIYSLFVMCIEVNQLAKNVHIKARSHRPNGRIAYGLRINPDFCTSFTRFGGDVRGCMWHTICARIMYGSHKNGVSFVRNTLIRVRNTSICTRSSFEPFKTCNRVKLVQKSWFVRDPYAILAFGPVWPGLY